MVSWRMRLVLAAATLVFVLTGCASSSSAPQAAASSAVEPTTSDSVDTTESAETPTESPARADEPTVNEAAASPLQEALGFDPDDQIEITNNYIRSAEELVRECMADRGFEYLPNDPSFSLAFARQLELQASIGDEQFVDEYGYGVATLFELDFKDDGVLAFVDLLLGPPPTEARTEAEQEAYEIALGGDSIQGLSAEEAQAQAFAVNGPAPDGSCRNYGYETPTTPEGEVFNGLQSLLGDELAVLGERFENDPRIRDATAQWQACMATQGHSYEQAGEITDEITDKANDIGTRFQQSPEALDIFARAIEADLSSMNKEQRFEFLDSAGALQGLSMVPSLQAELDQLIDFELAVARHSFDCTDQQLIRAVQLEIEQSFVEEHAAQLALIAAGESG